MTRKSEQLASTLHRIVQDIIQRGLADPRIGGLITITAVRVTTDLREAIFSVSVLPEERQTLTLHGLQAAAAHIRHEASEEFEFPKLPSFVFRLDESLKRQAAIFRALNKAASERRETSAPTGNNGPDDTPGAVDGTSQQAPDTAPTQRDPGDTV